MHTFFGWSDSIKVYGYLPIATYRLLKDLSALKYVVNNLAISVYTSHDGLFSFSFIAKSKNIMYPNLRFKITEPEISSCITNV